MVRSLGFAAVAGRGTHFAASFHLLWSLTLMFHRARQYISLPIKTGQSKELVTRVSNSTSTIALLYDLGSRSRN